MEKREQNIEIEGQSEREKEKAIKIEILNNLNMRECYECSKFVCQDCVRLCMKCKRAICKFDYQNENEGKIGAH